MKKTVENQENLDIIQDIVTELKTENGKVTGISTKTGLEFTAKVVILATGTFEGAYAYRGQKNKRRTYGRAFK